MMNVQPRQSDESRIHHEQDVQALYQGLLTSWNTRNAAAFAAPFTQDSHVVGFDGSLMNGQAEIEATIRQIFADHQTATYIGKIRDIRFLAPTVALLHAVSGMVPPGGTDLNPAVNTIQTMVAVKDETTWHIALYQNTPAQFHGRPDVAQQLTDELRQVLAQGRHREQIA